MKKAEVIATAAEVEDDAYLVARYGDNLSDITENLNKLVKAMKVTNIVNRNKKNEIKTPMVTLRALTQAGQHILSNYNDKEEMAHFNYGIDLDLRRAVAKSKREVLLSSADVLERSVKHFVEKLGESRDDAEKMVKASPAYLAALARESDDEEEEEEVEDDGDAEEVEEEDEA